jgi:hypothetical protein
MFDTKKRYFSLQKYKDYAIVTAIKKIVILVTGHCFLEHKHVPVIAIPART